MNSLKRKVLSTVSSMLLVLFFAFPALAAQFVDVPGGYWAESAIENLTRQGVLTGYPTGEFRPEKEITRAEFATMLVKTLNMENRFVDTEDSFRDVLKSFWAYRSIEIAAENGLISGYPGGYFRPSRNISRAESMAILVNASNIQLPSRADTERILQDYTDGFQVPQWAERHVAAAIQAGIFANYPGRNLIEPNQPASRSEVAVMTEHLRNYIASRSAPQKMPSLSQIPGRTTGTATRQGDLIRGHVAVVPASTLFTAVATNSFSSDRSRIGDPVTLTLDRPVLSSSGEIVVPQGSQIIGSITNIEPAGRAEKNAEMTLDFNRLVTPDGRTFAVSAEVNAENGILTGGTTRGRVGRIAGRTVGGAAAGGAAGAILGAIKGGGRVDDYLARGAVIGGSVGAASSIISRGKEVLVQPGEALEIRLRQPLTLSSP